MKPTISTSFDTSSWMTAGIRPSSFEKSISPVQKKKAPPVVRRGLVSCVWCCVVFSACRARPARRSRTMVVPVMVLRAKHCAYSLSSRRGRCQTARAPRPSSRASACRRRRRACRRARSRCSARLPAGPARRDVVPHRLQRRERVLRTAPVASIVTSIRQPLMVHPRRGRPPARPFRPNSVTPSTIVKTVLMIVRPPASR